VTASEPTVRVDRHVVCCIPEDNINAHLFAVNVEYRGRGLWAVTRLGECLSASGEWDYEMRPSSREDEWLAEHRFDEQTAIKLAKEAAPKVRVNGWTVERFLADIEAGGQRG
jgi:hypothetical protein